MAKFNLKIHQRGKLYDTSIPCFDDMLFFGQHQLKQLSAQFWQQQKQVYR